jgi:hypothetical protein
MIKKSSNDVHIRHAPDIYGCYRRVQIEIWGGKSGREGEVNVIREVLSKLP